jgi:hypothetical protein
MRSPYLALAYLLLLPGASALADQYALSLDAGVGATALWLPAPHAESAGNQPGSSLRFEVGLRYALTHDWEVTASGFFEPTVRYAHAGTVVQTADGRFEGALAHRLGRYGASGGMRYIRGSVWRWIGGLELGWSHRTYSDLKHFDVAGSARDFQLGLSGFGANNLTVAPLVGLEWAFSNHASVALIPRLHLMIGPEPAVGFTASAVFSYAWYL